ncbi:gamma-glutamyltransferase family protein [Yoonia sediminilitoris]|uniref:Gamma-glutamyltranspeptidase/glutathione hydrolase n=1 Tax=Yoonia sediminilitoris TaxID=1286148 RepID=A0A2T6KPI9_9RHOB|nr:gamma-glutamyltransferase family protein [Yoonia sediminilitoris]PUB18480.1 gamma-glutamyltranspeptidase/glutathione hydrolase [Yoonia sediminilitoris]RCW98648.1 gamma-glutamyltranspeptidase/glutathione hydrolase [Yoonia sediminilitoris]
MRDFHKPGRSAVFATNGICATSHPLASKVAVQMLEAGGNAMDAAIAGAVLLGFCEPQMTGIGGDCFVLMTPPGEDRVIALNGSGRAPAGIDAAALRAKGPVIAPYSADAVSVPGAIDAFCRLSKDWGALGLKAVLAPAIHYAEAGIPVAPRVAFDWAQSVDNLSGQARDMFLLDGAAPKPGQMFRAPKQAEVLRRVAMDGREGFYEGDVAEDMVASLNALGGTHTLDDFADTACDYTEPVTGGYGGLDLFEHPPNGQGATAILLLNILKHFNIAGMDPWGAERAHIEAEATKLAYDTRNRFVADPAYMTRLDYMTAPETAAKLAALIDPAKAMPGHVPGAEAVHKDTIYITVVDKDRMCVSLIYSVFHSFGSGIASDKFGVLFQNRGAGFTLEEGHPNEVGPGKRPMHTIIPGLLTKDGKPYMPFGVMGGQYQSTGHARFVTNVTDFGLSPQGAIDAPRCFAEGDVLNVEDGYSDSVKAQLSALGHNVQRPETAIGGAQAIMIHDDGVLEAGSDPRKDGCAIGY